MNATDVKDNRVAKSVDADDDSNRETEVERYCLRRDMKKITIAIAGDKI